MIFFGKARYTSPDELLADFQQYYNLDVEKIAEEDIVRAAILATQLPMGARIMREQDSRYGWNDATRLLALLEYDLRIIINSKRKKPKSTIDPPLSPAKNRNEVEKEREEHMTLQGEKMEAVSIDEINRIFGIEE